jgi:hypothetical protein
MSAGQERCINCGKDEFEVPIMRAKFRGAELVICSSCLPVLIHKPQQLAAKLDGAESIQAPDEH